MKRAFIAALIAATLSPVAHAEFCDAPLTAGAEQSIKRTPHYRAYPDEVGKAVYSFCWLGMEAARNKQNAAQVETRADIEARRWINSKYGADGMADSERWTLQAGLANAMIAGYTLTPQPPLRATNKAAGAKAAAEKKAAAAKAAAEKRQRDSRAQ